MTQPVELRPGDYIRTKGLTEGQYHAVARAFIDAGAEPGRYPIEDWQTHTWIEWWRVRNTFVHTNELGVAGRELTVEQILGVAKPEWNGEGLPPIGARLRVRIPSIDIDSVAEVVGHHLDRAIVWLHQDMSYRPVHPEYLRPLKTPEQVELGELETLVRRFACDGATSLAGAIQRAGYRKT